METKRGPGRPAVNPSERRRPLGISLSPTLAEQLRTEAIANRQSQAQIVERAIINELATMRRRGDSYRAALTAIGRLLRRYPGLERLEDRFVPEPGPIHVTWGINERFRARALMLVNHEVSVTFVDRGLGNDFDSAIRRYASTDEGLETAADAIAHYILAGIDPSFA